MKNIVKLLSLVVVLGFGVSTMKAQSYRTGIGLLADVGDGVDAVGPHLKHFFAGNHAGEFGVLFGGRATHLNFMYQYQKNFAGASGLAWYLGFGPGVTFHRGGGSTFSIAPVAGLDFKIPGAPLDLFFDWRPRVWFYEYDSYFAAGRFGLGMRITL